MATETALAECIGEEYERYLRHLAGRVERAVRFVPREMLWTKPFDFGNSLGHLVLHLTGNLNHYIGAQVAGTAYIRDRPREFTEPVHPQAEELLGRFHEAVDLVVRTARSLDAAGWTAPIAEELPIRTGFGLFLVCTAHLNNHIGQMSYLVQALGHSTQEPPVW
jgi:hypothetical protein